jgi:hypothetical protein
VNAVRETVSPPGIITYDIDAATQTPVFTDRSFLISRRQRENNHTPVDELTRLPLPLVPLQTPINADWHHHFHPKRSPVLQEAGGVAVRNARLQRCDRRQHNAYHNAYFGPPLPQTEEEQFATVIMSVAGYMPHYAIALKKGEPQIVRLYEDQRQRLQTSGEIKVGSTETVRKFLRGYVLSQSIESVNVNDLTIEEFLTTQNVQRRYALGHTLLGLITEKATEKVDDTYYQARRQELLLPGLASSARRFTKTSLGSRRMRDRMVDHLHLSLAA